MLSEVRIYYESIEQANYFIKEPFFDKDEVLRDITKLVVKEKDYKKYSKRVAPIIFNKNPDLLITKVENNIEYPLLMIEFSTAVFTKDHELQRTDSFKVASENNCIFVKVSSTKKMSRSEHGGGIDFNFIAPYSHYYKNKGITFYHFEWPLINNNTMMKNNPAYLSIPDISELDGFQDFMLGFIRIIKNEYKNNWHLELSDDLSKNIQFFKEWNEKLVNCPSEDITQLNSTRLKWYENHPLGYKNCLELKFNRFGHAMDPERGMLADYSSRCNMIVSKMILSAKNESWFKDVSREKEIREHINEIGLNTAGDLLYVFFLGSGISRFLSQDFLNEIKSINSKHCIYNLSKIIEEYYYKLNKGIRMIIDNSLCFYITTEKKDCSVKIIWDNKSSMVVFDKYPDCTQIRYNNTISEDDVTFATVHGLFKKNNIEVLAVSYPGAQSDKAILPEPDKGRKQSRKYIDVVAHKKHNYFYLQENKGPFNINDVKSDVEELTKYRFDEKYAKALFEYKKFFGLEKSDLKLVLGVGFGNSKNLNKKNLCEVNIGNMDYFMLLNTTESGSNKEWSVWKQGNEPIFDIYKSNIDFPPTYKLFKCNH